MEERKSKSVFEVSMDDVQPYEFRPFVQTDDDGNLKEYTFKPLESFNPAMIEEKKKLVLLESKTAERNSFEISPIVKQHRGIKEQENVEREQRIEDEVRKRFIKVKEEGFQQGYEAGLEKGRVEVHEKMKADVDSKLEKLEGLIESALVREQELIKTQKFEVYNLIKTICKWVTLKELKDDGKYLERLLEKLVLEIGTRENLHISVSGNDFEQMPEILEHVEKKIGKFTNVRLEVSNRIESGINIESENSLIIGTMEQQLENMNKLFESVGLTSAPQAGQGEDE